jgi:hypothetical protein
MESWDELQIEAIRTPLTYAYLRAAARAALAQKTPAGAMAASVFAAFAAEAYFNHVGQERIAYWEVLESLNPRAKAVLLNDVLLKREVDWSKAPYQTLAEAIGYRNALAHGKTQTAKLTTSVAGMPDNCTGWPQVKWEKCYDLSVAERLLTDVELLIEEMHAALGTSGSAFPFGPKKGGA